MEPARIQKMVEDHGDTLLIYEFLSKAGPMAVNGQPSFFSMSVLRSDDTARLFAKMDELRPPKQETADA